MMKIGIDAGGTLIKVACLKNNELLELKKFQRSQMKQAASWIYGIDSAGICITGGRAAQFRTYLTKPTSEMLEFEATSHGIRYLLAKNAISESSYILTNVGTGTSIHHIDQMNQQRVGGTGVGGGTIMGLSRLLTGLSDYEDIVNLAAQGSRDRIDLKVKHIYEGTEPPIPGDLTASNFGNILSPDSTEEITKEERLASVIGLVGETVATVSVFAAGQCGVSTIFFIGSSFIGNPLLKEVVESYTRLRGAMPMFIENGEYCGAIGAALAMK